MRIVHEAQDYYVVESKKWECNIGWVKFVLVDKKTFKASSTPSLEPKKLSNDFEKI